MGCICAGESNLLEVYLKATGEIEVGEAKSDLGLHAYGLGSYRREWFFSWGMSIIQT